MDPVNLVAECGGGPRSRAQAKGVEDVRDCAAVQGGFPAADAAAGAGCVAEPQTPPVTSRTRERHSVAGTRTPPMTTPRVRERQASTSSVAGTRESAANRRFSWREDLAVAQHSARVGRSSSEGSIRSSASNSKPAKARGQRARVERKEQPFAWLERNRSAASSGSGPSEACGLASAFSSSPTSPSKVVDGRDLYQQVSSLVEELENARSRALASGGRPPRAVEAAASALEPLLRLRDVTGAFTCDLTAMPWLPQLLAVFRNVLHTAVDGPGAPPRTPRAYDVHLTSADSGAGSLSSNLAAAVAAASAAAGDSAGSAGQAALAGLTGASVLLELEALRERSQLQDTAIRDCLRREKELQEELQDLKRERCELQQQVRLADDRAEFAQAAVWKAGAAAEDEATASTASTSPRDLPAGPTDTECTRLARRVAGLERESCRWQSEKRSVEERLVQLVDLVSAAVDSDSETRPQEQCRPSQLRPERHRRGKGSLSESESDESGSDMMF